MNRTLEILPDSTVGTYVYETPPWLVLTFRSIQVTAGCVGLFLSIQHWSAIPWSMRLFVLALTLTLIISSVWNRPWQNTVHFVANEHGIYFPAYPAMTLVATPQRVEWLEVPWKHISNIRLVSALGEHGKCVAMDIQVSFLEETRFFEGVGVPNDRLTKTVATVSAAYSNWPPFPAEVFSRLSTLRLTRLGVDPSHALKAIR